MPWHGPIPFGQGLGPVDAVTMIQSNYGTPGNLEVIARVGGRCSSSGVFRAGLPLERPTPPAVHVLVGADYQNTGRPGLPIHLRSCDLLHIAVHSLWVKVPDGVARTAWQSSVGTVVRGGLSAGSQSRAGFPGTADSVRAASGTRLLQ
jgi:hypothetical protein